jgi:hypothetical protein
MVKYALEQRIVLYDSYMKRNPINRVREGFIIKYPDAYVPATSTIFKLVTKVCSTGAFVDKK